jgi:integrase
VELDPAALLAWGSAALALGPARRDLLLLMALSGLRSVDARSARAEHLSPGLLRVPSPKGGRAFGLPLSPPLHDLLRSRVASARGGWLFPADSASGHMEEVRVKAWAGTPLQEMVGHYLRHLSIGAEV